jgi:hypothetical protein
MLTRPLESIAAVAGIVPDSSHVHIAFYFPPLRASTHDAGADARLIGPEYLSVPTSAYRDPGGIFIPRP